MNQHSSAYRRYMRAYMRQRRQGLKLIVVMEVWLRRRGGSMIKDKPNQ